MKNHWYERAAREIRRELDHLPLSVRNPSDADSVSAVRPEDAKVIIGNAVQATMPHPHYGKHAYEHWHQARKDVLAERFPDLFPKHKKETDGRLF